MSEIEKRISELSDKIESLQQRQYGLINELQTLHNEMHDLKILLRNESTGSNENDNVVPPKIVPEIQKPFIVKPRTFFPS